MNNVRLWRFRIIGCSFLLGILTPAFAQQGEKAASAGAASFHVAQTFKVGGDGGWDYITVDPSSKLLYVPRSTHTLVIDSATGKTVADIPGQQRNHGVAIAPTTGRGFISDGRDGSVSVFDLKLNKVFGKVKVADDADAIIFDPASNKVFVGCGDAGVLVPIAADIDLANGKAGEPIALEGKPEGIASDGRGRVFVNLEDKDKVAVIDTKTMKVIDRWSVSPGGAPVGLAIDPEHGRLFVGCRKPQMLIVINTADGKVLADVPIGAGVDAARFDNGLAFASCRDGTLAVAKEVSPGKFDIVQTVKTQMGARTMDVDPLTHTIYLPTAEMEPAKDANSRPTPKPDSFVILVVQPEGK
ncbi:MAG: YncE family protein [Planctomycetes bacterium]|nr:YncE family protein [Planctomycetota bacterium]MBI3833009.1 YncE family protein [Planctomycetota bacterium]